MSLISPSFPNGLPAARTEAEIRDIRARRNLMEANMRADGTPEKVIERLATDETAAQALSYERRVIDTITSLLGPR